MIAHISPASSAFEESRNTLTYAGRAKNIKTRVRGPLLCAPRTRFSGPRLKPPGLKPGPATPQPPPTHTLDRDTTALAPLLARKTSASEGPLLFSNLFIWPWLVSVVLCGLSLVVVTVVDSLVVRHGLWGMWALKGWLTGLVAPRHVRSSQTRHRTHVPCIGRQTLNHRTTREVPALLLFKVCAHPQGLCPQPHHPLPASCFHLKRRSFRRLRLQRP